jgi:hypothetical protein
MDQSSRELAVTLGVGDAECDIEDEEHRIRIFPEVLAILDANPNPTQREWYAAMAQRYHPQWVPEFVEMIRQGHRTYGTQRLDALKARLRHLQTHPKDAAKVGNRVKTKHGLWW